MSIGWNFPSNNYGQLVGISEAGIETFKGMPYRSLAREICQNSLDAVLNLEEAVIVEFEKLYIHKEDIPSYDELKDALERCHDFWSEQKIKKAVDFFSNALKVINNEKICVLRISDFNTSGLTGSDREYSNTPWQNLVKASGVSGAGKGDSAGGSFGIGKSAPFACSEIRTIFYSTYDSDNLRATQGVSRLVSFKDANSYITQGMGYYGCSERNTPLQSELGMDENFDRGNRTGTDIFILGFTDNDEWEREMTKSIVDDFLISIYDGKLAVKIGRIGINKETLPLIISEYKEDARLAYNYYQVLISGNTIVIKQDFENMGEIELSVLLDANLHRKALILRSNGMKILDKQNISATIHFAAILRLNGANVNKYFREMETPQHNNWEHDRHHNPKEAKKMKAALFRLVKETILELGRSNTADEIDADGIGEYLPDDMSAFDISNPPDKNEAISDNTKDIEIKVVERTSVPKGVTKIETGQADEKIDAFGDLIDDETPNDDIGRKPNGKLNTTQGGIGTKHNAIGNEDSDNAIKKWVEVGTSAIRLFTTNNITNEYKLIVLPEKNAPHGYIKIQLAGEQSSIEAKIKSAQNNGQNLTCSGGKIFINDIRAKQKIVLSFFLDYSDNCSMEVNVYGYSI